MKSKKINSSDNTIKYLNLIPLVVDDFSFEALKKRLEINNLIVSFFSFVAMLNKDYINNDMKLLEQALMLSTKSFYLRTLLIQKFTDISRFDIVKKLYELEEEHKFDTSNLNKKLIKAQLNNDYNLLFDTYLELYLNTGLIKYINDAIDTAHNINWQKNYEIYLIKILIVQGKELHTTIFSMLKRLDIDGKHELVLNFQQFMKKLPEHKFSQGLILTIKFFREKNYKKCLELLHKSKLLENADNYNAVFSNYAAKCYEKLKDYKNAAKYYKKQNDIIKKPNFTLNNYLDFLNNLKNIKIEEPLDDSHDNYFIMTGFPRSGTTLLENALAAHPFISTCEETSSLSKSINIALVSPMKEDPNHSNMTLRIKYAQNLYYENLNRYVKNNNAKCIIDKTPILSSNILFLEKIFPNKKYIFSIRHPYDVVLSNFKQEYSQNNAMAAFNDFYEACILYNEVMQNWFTVFPEKTDRVHYIYYHDLVLDFKNQMENVIEFLDLEWTNEVLNFVEHSQKRVVKTPSYENVRKGLDIGVQTSWENYKFLFDKKCKALLDPWVEKFGYNE